MVRSHGRRARRARVPAQRLEALAIVLAVSPVLWLAVDPPES